MRFIPTSVGNTERDCFHADLVTVHPHVRGEHSMREGIRGVTAGSSPRPWGTPGNDQSNLSMIRFIPTSVGNTRHLRMHCIPSTVHPHVRGEHVIMIIKILQVIGSSPRPWGTRRNRGEKGGSERFIPTSVGNTSSICWFYESSTVHPHVRGEHTRSV